MSETKVNQAQREAIQSAIDIDRDNLLRAEMQHKRNLIADCPDPDVQHYTALLNKRIAELKEGL